MLVVDHVGRTFDGGRIVGVEDVSLEIGAEELIALHGQSGCGKSTLINLMAGLDQPTSGSVRFDGRLSPTPEEWTALRASRIGIVFQDFNLLPTLTAAENVEAAMFGSVRSARERRDRARARLADVGIADCADRLPPQLSGGERRRVALARGLANKPAILLADEPTSNLDTASGAQVTELMLSLHARGGMSMVIVTHDSGLIARCPRRIAMLDGRIVEDVRAHLRGAGRRKSRSS